MPIRHVRDQVERIGFDTGIVLGTPACEWLATMIPAYSICGLPRNVWRVLIALCFGAMLMTSVGAAADQGNEAVVIAMRAVATGEVVACDDCEKGKLDVTCLSCAFAHDMQAVATSCPSTIVATPMAGLFLAALAETFPSAPARREPDPPRS